MSVALRRYFRGATLATMVTPLNGERRTYHLDHQGTVQCLTNAQGVVTDRFACDAWGNEFRRTGPSINRQWYIGHLGYYRQVDQALDYVRARSLHGGRGAWTSIGVQDVHPYAYVTNQASSHIDPTGEIKIEAVLRKDWIFGDGLCGDLLAYWHFVRTSSKCVGWIVQEITYQMAGDACQVPKRLPFPRRRFEAHAHYWEAWRIGVDPLTGKPDPIPVGAGRRGYTDCFQHNNMGQTSGRYRVQGKVKFFCATTIKKYALTPGADPGQWPRGHQPGAPSCSPASAGSLPNTTTEPPWWQLPSDEGEETNDYHWAVASWGCCCADKKGSTDVQPG